MRAAVGRLGIIGVVFTVASCAAGPSARVESTAAVPAHRVVPGTEVSLVVPDGFALDERAQTVSCADASSCGTTTLYVAWRVASASRDPAELFVEEVEGQLRKGHALTEIRIGGVDAVRLDAAPATVNPGEIMRDYRLRMGARTVRFHLEGHVDHADAFDTLGRAVEDATLLPAIAPIDRGWSLADDLGLRVHESSPDYAYLGPGERPEAGEPGLAVAYACYTDATDADAGDDRHRTMVTQLLQADGLDVIALTPVTVDGVRAIEGQGGVVGGAGGQERWSTVVFRADRPLVLTAEHGTGAGSMPLARYRDLLAGIRMTGSASAAACA